MTFSTSGIIIVGLLGLAAATEAQDRRDLVGAERSRAMEAVVAAAFPGVTLDWEHESLVGAGAPSGRLALSGFTRVPFLDGYIVASAMEFPAKIAKAVEAVKAFQDAKSEAGQFVILRMSKEGVITDKRVAVLDASSLTTECQRIEVVQPPTGGGWPYLQVAYSSIHRGDDWVGGITWTMTFDPDRMRVVRRVPTAFWQRTRQGNERSDMIAVVSSSAGELRLFGRLSGRQWTVRCSDGCIVSADEILTAP